MTFFPGNFHTNVEPRPQGNEGSADTTADPATPSAPADSTSAPPATTVSGNLKGRDPDLIYEGETIMVNGKPYEVQKDDTLSSIAVKVGLAREGNQQEILNGVVKLATENGMDLSLMDRRGFEGLTPTGPQPPNGGSTTPPRTTSNASAQGTPSDEPGAPSNSDGSTPANQGSSQGDEVWASLVAQDPQMKLDNGFFRTQREKDSGIFGGPLEAGTDRVKQLYERIDLVRQNQNSRFTPAQLDHMEALITKAANGGSLSAVEKYALNMFGAEQNEAIGLRKIALNSDDSTGSTSLA